MKSIRIEIKKKVYEFQLAESWDELPNHLYPSIARLFLRKAKHMNEYDKLVRALAILMDENIDVLWKLSEYDIISLLPLVEWIFLKIDLSTNKIAEIEVDGVKYIGPDFDFSSIRFGEFVMAETYFMQFVESEMESKETLAKLASVLYRVKGIGNVYTPGHADYRGDERQKFNGNLIDGQSKAFMNIEIDILEAVYLWYAVARETFFSYFPNVFRSRKSTQKNTSKTPKTFGWIGVFDDLLGEKGRTAETLEDEFVSTTLLSLERSQIKVKEMKNKK